MKIQPKITRVLMGVFCALVLALPVMAKTYPPVIDMTTILNDIKFENSGKISFKDASLAFAPADASNTSVEVVDDKGTVLKRFDYYPEYAGTVKTFAKIRVKGLPEMNIKTGGQYFLEFKVNNKPSTRFPFSVKVLGSDDPFDTTTEFRFDGPWRSLGYILMRSYDETELPDIVFWTGWADLAKGKTSDKSIAKLFRDGKLVAHSKRRMGYIGDEPYQQNQLALFHPHEEDKVNVAKLFSSADLLVDGKYNIRIERQSDNALLRNFDVIVAGGKIQPVPRSVLGHEPTQDLLVPRVKERGANFFRFIPVIWLEDLNR